jgi:malonyl-CoA O-methyltransferase
VPGRGASGIGVVQADYAALPFAPAAFDMLWSNLALHWHGDPARVFPEWQRVLTVGGLLMFSTLGPDTLRELRAAWRQADAESGDGAPAQAHVIDFVDMHDFGDMLIASGFEVPVMDMETIVVTYRSPESLLADVRRWGAYPFAASPPSAGADTAGGAQRAAGLSGRKRHAALLRALERGRREDGTLALSFEVIYGHAWKSAPHQTAEGYGIVRLDDIGRAPARGR